MALEQMIFEQNVLIRMNALRTSPFSTNDEKGY
jgi:hypothetical protein